MKVVRVVDDNGDAIEVWAEDGKVNVVCQSDAGAVELDHDQALDLWTALQDARSRLPQREGPTS